jgi:D-glycero-D-manno-heptose 1,7-bisphosphate phosphatase
VAEPGRAAVFLDRDGTVVEERDYLRDPADVHLVPGAAEAIGRLRDAGLAVVLVTNQSGIARGLYGEADFRAVQDRLVALLREANAAVDATYHCSHHPDFTGPCECRKPGPGMYLAAARDLALAPERSWFVGDKLTDVEAASRFGGRGILVRTGYGREAEARVRGGVDVV